MTIKKNPLSLAMSLFNIVPAQWSRVSECWLITFFFKIGSAIGWTVLTAMFISRFGIGMLPALFVINATLIVLGTFFFENFIMRIQREILMVVIVVVAIICLLFAAVVYIKNPLSFFILAIFAESVFLAQFNVFIPILVGDRFTPLESQKTFPFIESAETIGGMVGGAIVGIFASQIQLTWFVYMWIVALLCVLAVFMGTALWRKIPTLPLREERRSKKRTDQIRLVLANVRRLPFLKGLIVIVLFQWVFMNILDFQYTKSIEQAVTGRIEQSIAHVDPKILQVSTLNSKPGTKTEPRGARELTSAQETRLTEKLGTYKSLFFAGALIVQIIVASRLITSFGVVGSMILHPVIMLMSLVGMFLKFGLPSSLVTKMNFEITNVIHKNAYFASHYALPKNIRDQAAEFLEGIVRPIGTILGMLCIVMLQLAFRGTALTSWITIALAAIMVFILITTIRLQSKYTNISEQQLFAPLPYPEKLNAIEVLSQKGHRGAAAILVRKLQQNGREAGETQEAHEVESPLVRTKIITALGQLRDYGTIPEILNALYDEEADVRLAAANALMNFSDIGTKFYSQAFSRYRTVEVLKEVFRSEKFANVRSALIRVFSLLHEPDTVSFLLEVLHDPSPEIQADCIYTLGLFKDPTTAHYIMPFLSHEKPFVAANAIVALWQFPTNRELLDEHIDKLVTADDAQSRKAAIYMFGEIGNKRHKLLREAMNGDSEELRIEAAFALTKCGGSEGLHALLAHALSLENEEFGRFKRFITRLKPDVRKIVKNAIGSMISEEIGAAMKTFKGSSLHDLDAEILERLRRLYSLLGVHEELFTIEQAIAARNSKGLV